MPTQRLLAAASSLSKNPNVQFAQLDYRIPASLTPNDPGFRYQWHLTNMYAPGAWDITLGAQSVIIAVLDTGVEATHPDLAPTLVPGWNCYDNTVDTTDVLGHGTSVAGVAAAAANNGIGVASVAPNCMLMPIRISDPQGYGYDSTVANGLVWAADHGARVANISYEFSGSAAVKAAAEYFRSKGGVVTMAASNGGQTLTLADNTSVLTVSAIASTGLLPSWSNRGAVIDLSAPGVGIYTTYMGATYNSLSGTSFAAPCVAGVAALVISVNPSFTAAQVEDILKKSADDLGTVGWDANYGWGRVNAQKAVNLAAKTIPPTDTSAPAVTIASPATGANVKGVTAVQVTAVDNVAVSQVNLIVDGQMVAATTNSPFSFSWDTSYLTDGSHTISASAADLAGNIGFSGSTTVSAQNGGLDIAPPIVQIISPSATVTVTKSLTVSVSASDNVSVTRVDLLVDGKVSATSSSSNPTFTLSTTKLSKGTHALQALAYDRAGNCGKSAVVTIKK